MQTAVIGMPLIKARYSTLFFDMRYPLELIMMISIQFDMKERERGSELASPGGPQRNKVIIGANTPYRQTSANTAHQSPLEPLSSLNEKKR